MSLRDQNKQDKHARILAAARDLFAEQGFAATTTKAVAERAGVATGTVFLYARNKEDLLMQVWRGEIAGAVQMAFGALPKGDLLDQLCHIFGTFGAFYAQDLALSSVYMREALFASGEDGVTNRSFTYEFLGAVGGLVEAAMARGELRPDANSVMASTSFFAAYLMVLLGLLHGELDLDGFNGALRACLSQQIQGLAPGHEDGVAP